MAKRQMDSTIIQQNWYMELDSRARNLWWHLFLSCDNIGVFEVNTRLIGVYTGEKFTRSEIFSLFGGRVAPVPRHPDKGIIVDFVACQSKGGIRGNAPWQRAMRTRMEELGIDEDYLKRMSERKKGSADEGVTDVDEGQEELELDGGGDERPFDFDTDKAFETFWSSYPSECPRKVDKKKCRAKFKAIMDGAENKIELVTKIMDGLARWRRCDTWVRDGGRFIRAPLVWLNSSCWEDEPKEYEDADDRRGSGRKPTNWRRPAEDAQDASVL